MAKNIINILCPSGHRRKAQMSPNSNLLQVVEDMCNQENLDSSEWGLKYQRNKCDLTIPWRLQSIPTNAVLEIYSGWFEPTVTLQEMLDWFRIQPESMVAALDISMSGNHNSCPVCSYLSEEIIGEYALANTTLRELGLTSGTAVIRYDLRPVTDKELQKINGRIDEKIVRRRQQQHEQEQKSKQAPQQQQTTKPAPAPTPVRSSPSSSNSNPSRSLTNSNAPSSNDEEYSIFRDPPPRPVQSATTRSQQQSRTLAEELGINISLDLEPRRQQSQTDFRNFKFPESTRGKDLYHNESEDEYRRAQNTRPCDRRPIAYELTKSRPIRDTRDKKSEEVPDNFYELTPGELQSLLNDLHRQSSNENPLETREMRERAQSARNMSYEQIAIRFVINSRYVLQGLFRPEEPVSRLIEFAQTHLICPYIGQTDFYLYTTPPRVELSDLRKPLLAYDLAPAAFVHLGHRTISSLNIQLAKNVSVRTIEEANQLVTHYVFNRSKPMNTREQSTLFNERPTSATSLIDRPTRRNPPASNIDDKQLREKLRKFLPGKK